MPRLVLLPTPARVARTAPRMRRPTRAPACARKGALDLGAALEIAGRHAMPGRVDVDVARLQRLQFGEAGGAVDLGDRRRKQARHAEDATS